MKKQIGLVLLALTVTVGAACARREIATGGRLAPSLVLEQFMRAANAKDLGAMSRVFGTKDGPVAGKWGRTEIEQRMFAIAAELRHNDFEVVGEEMVPGRTETATKLNVRVTNGEGKFIVPFTLVRFKSGWLVEQIGIEVLTGPKKR